MKRNIIGEGSYGCVHKPSIHCKTPPTPNFNYDNYVSKIMETKNAKKELNEFLVIQKIDPTDEYHLGEPILCKPNLNEPNINKDIKKCKHLKGDFENNPDDYSLLLLKFGGKDLKMFCKNYLIKYLENNKNEKIDKFWLEVHHLIKGLKFFKENGIVHNDIKPQNILFDPTNGKMKYIDFGLMRSKNDILNLSKTNDNFLGSFHWSYPFDCGFMNNRQFLNYKNRNALRRTYWKNELSELIVANSNINTLDLPINHPEAFKILFTYLNPNNTIPDASTQYGYIDSFFDGFNEMIAKSSYNNTLNFIIDSIDVFGLGFTLQYMANCFKQHNAINLPNFTRLSTFFHKMYDFNPSTRVIEIDALLNEYENILLEIGVLTRLNKTFENNTLVDKSPAPPIIMKEIKIDSKSSPKHLSAELQSFANKNIIEIEISCGENKELNPITKRCVKKCKQGFTRNSKFQCRKTRKARKTISKSKSKSRSKSRTKSRSRR
jgi:serine/threonine protein kinase